MRKLIICLLICTTPIEVFAACSGSSPDWTAADTTYAEVAACVTAASDGDTINVPAGSSTWASTLAIPTTKSLKLVGAGSGSTIITASVSDAKIIDVGENDTEITGFTFSDGNVWMSGRGWRIHHNSFTSDCTGNSVQEAIDTMGGTTYGFDNAPKGLIDNNSFHNMRIVSSAGPAMMANEVWGRSLGLGTDEAVYIEDNTFTYDATCTTIQAADGNYGGSYVFRYNTVQDASVMAHAVQDFTGSGNRALRKWEIYNNKFWQKGSAWVPAFLRAGTGVFFNNELVGSWSDPNVIMDDQRSCTTMATSGKCDGTSSWDGNEAGESGYPCRDQIGRSTDAVAIPYTSNPGAAQAQELDPAYAWNNYVYPTEQDRIDKTNGTAVLLTEKSDICAEAKAHLKENVDYYNGSAKPGYAAYAYPHPLRGVVQYFSSYLSPTGGVTFKSP